MDFGCGPGPALADMLERRGLQVALYDRFYHPDKAVFAQRFDFICATEVIEHLASPDREIHRLWQHLVGGGVFAIMTKLVISRERFANWHYIRDPTHIAFYSRATLQWLAHRLGAELEFVDDDVIFLIKPGQG
jgi:2-polyprenyl-3-methyl-5-hydroxy-6-metoxy-1,4-benzoquinol methylase